MSEFFIASQTNVYNLELSGSIGEFCVEPMNSEEKKSVRVKYLQTHVGFDSSTNNERLLENMVPVREIFEINELKFDELMQRNIDDGRVSNSLIPYLLRVGTGEAIHFFPPIVAVALPLKENRRPADCYPNISEREEAVPGHNNQITRKIMAAGQDDEATFAFSQINNNGKLVEHDNARLMINTNKCRLVIVDGQHRAMALIAIYRNLKSWPDKTQAYKDYYKRWAASELSKIKLTGISLPIVILTFPELTQDGSFQMKVTEACRSIFLALNKNARPVSTARNILLDDEDIIAGFLRETLEQVKQKDISSPKAMRLWNFELDSEVDKRAVSSTVAFSGVMPVYNLIERIMLNNSIEVTGVQSDNKRYSNITNLTDCMKRLNGTNILGSLLAGNLKRNTVSKDAAHMLKESYLALYGRKIVEGFEQFFPFEAMAMASLQLETEVNGNLDRHCHSMLFEGQGVYQVFQTYLEELDSELRDRSESGQCPAELRIINDDLKSIKGRLQNFERKFFQERAARFLSAVAYFGNIRTPISVVSGQHNGNIRTL